MKKVLVACYGNTCRSPMLEGLLKRDLAAAGKEVAVESCGFLDKKDGAGANPHSITCMKQRGVDITSHRRRYAGDLDLKGFDHIYVMGTDVRDALVSLGAPPDRIEVLREDKGGSSQPLQQ